MNPLKNLFNKVFEAPSTEGAASAPKEESAFEWNPDEETVAATSSRQTEWKKGEAPVEPWVRLSSRVMSKVGNLAGREVRPVEPTGFALAKEAEMQARQELDAFVTEKRAEVERLRLEITEAEERFAELQERRRVEERRILEVSDHLSDAAPGERDETPLLGSAAVLRPQGA